MKKNPIKTMRKRVNKTKEKDIVALLMVRRTKKNEVESEYVIHGNNEDHIAISGIFLEAGNKMVKRLIKDGVLEIDTSKNPMYR